MPEPTPWPLLKHRRRAVVRLALALAALVAPARAMALDEARGEYEVKAAFLYNFALFVDWDKETALARGGELAVCVFGADPFGGVLDRTMAGKAIGSHPVAVRRLSRPEEGKTCAILFVGEREAATARTVLAAVRHLPVLTVGETDGFLEAGGAVRFFVDGGKVRFAVNLNAVDASHLKISSKLLSLAKTVRHPEGSPR